MTTVPVQIDLRPFVHASGAPSTNPILVLVGPSGEVGITAPIQSLHLEPGQYQVIVASGVVAEFTFTVTPQGTIDFDASFNTFLSGRATSTLVVTGFEFTFDARYITGQTTLFVLPDAVPVLNTRIRLLPASTYQFEQGSGSVAQWKLKVGLDGKLHYDPVLDSAQNGFLEGNVTSTLQLLGYPLLIDARASQASSVMLVPTGAATASPPGVMFANLLPTDNIALQLDNKRVPFRLDLQGRLHVDQSFVPFVRFDHFHGLARMTVLRPIV